MCYGYDWLGKQVRGLEEYMEQRGYTSLDQFLGCASDAALQYADMPMEKARVNPDLCSNCGRCLKACFSDAMQQGEESTWIKEENCVGCGGCYSVCPVHGAVEIVTC